MPPETTTELTNKSLCTGNDTENLLDVAALEVAFGAFQAAVKRRGFELIVLGNPYTDDQEFFINYCRTLCGEKWNCNEVLRELPAFSDAFACSEGSPMNPESKCGFFFKSRTA